MSPEPETTADDDGEDFLDEMIRESTERLSTFPSLMEAARHRRVAQAFRECAARGA